MAVNTQFSIAVHILAGLACGCDQEGVTSSHLAASVNTSPSFVRRTLAKLSKAGLVETTTGKAGACWLAKDAKNISLLDIYEAVDAPKAFSIHEYSEQKGVLRQLPHQDRAGKSADQNPEGHGSRIGRNQPGADRF